MKKLIVNTIVVLTLAAAPTAWPDALDDAITLWHMEDETDSNGPIFSDVGGMGGTDVSGEPITAPNFDDWAHEGVIRHWYNDTPPTPAPWDLVQNGAISVFVRVKMSALEGPGFPTHSAPGTQAHIWSMAHGNCGEFDSFRIQLTDGKPTFGVVRDDGSGTNTTYTDVVASGAIQTGVWYDMTGVFDPDNDLISITVSDPVTNEEIETATLAVAFDNIQPTVTLGNGNNDGEFSWFGYLCNDNTDTGSTDQAELTAVWDRALGLPEILELSGRPLALAVEESGGATAVQEEGATSDSFTVVLSLEQPTSDVTVVVDPNKNGDDITINTAGPNTPVTLTFTTANWDTPQTVTVTAVDDAEPEVTETVSILLLATSADDNYNVGRADSLSVTVLDNEAPQVVVNVGDGVEVTEGDATTDTYSLSLGAVPSDDVTIQVGGPPLPQPPLGDAVALWNMIDGSDLNGPVFIDVPGMGGIDISGEPIEAVNFNGWGTQGIQRLWYLDAPDLAPDLVLTSAVSLFVRVKMSSIHGTGETLIWTMPGDCDDLDNYWIWLVDGVPTFGVIEDDGSGTNLVRTQVSVAAAITTGVWYDMVGIYDPANDFISITVASPVTGQEIDSASATVLFDAIRPTTGGFGPGENGAEISWFGYPCNSIVNPSAATDQCELTAVWDRALSASEVALLTDPNAEATLISDLVQVQVNGLASDTLVFTADDWLNPQTVSVTAVDDGVLEFDHNALIAHAVSSDDPGYDGLETDSVSVAITDNECGVWGFHPLDFDESCIVGLSDFATLAAAFLDCSQPFVEGCINFLE